MPSETRCTVVRDGVRCPNPSDTGYCDACIDGPAASPEGRATPTPDNDEGCWAFECETAAAIESEMIRRGIRQYPDEGSYDPDEWARKVIADIWDAALSNTQVDKPRCQECPGYGYGCSYPTTACVSAALRSTPEETPQ